MSNLNPSYQKRRRQLAAKSRAELLVVGANCDIQQSRDQIFQFRQESNFYYLTGLTQAGWLLVIDFSSGQEFLIQPSRSPSQNIFDGPIDIDEASKTAQIDEVETPTRGMTRLKTLLAKSRRVGILKPLPSYIRSQHMLANPSRRRLQNQLRRYARAEFIDISAAISSIRAIKDEFEIELLDQAAEFTQATLKQIEKTLAAGQYSHESEIEADITAAFIRSGWQHGYEPIIAGGNNALTLHYIANNAPLKKNSLLLIDVGAKKAGYSADISRTFPVGSPPDYQLAVLELVKKVQSELIAGLKPGVTLRQLERKARNLLRESMLGSGLLGANNNDRINTYFPHSVSHFLGLDVHDEGDYHKPLREGMVLTVEPGLYMPKHGFGVRWEDDVLITRENARVLGYNASNK